jgi:iron complex transport system substrate-binding protein
MLTTVVGCRQPDHAPGVVVDDLGRAVVLAKTPQRLASLSPATTELLYAVGCGERLVLRDGWSDYPPQAKKVSKIDGLQPSAEAILAFRPDLVLVNFPSPSLQAALDGAGVPWAALSPETVPAVARSLRLVGQLCGEPKRGAEQATRFESGMAKLSEALRNQPKVKVFYEMDVGDGTRPFTIGRRSFASGLLEAAGGRNVFADRNEAWFPVGLEAILAADPDVVVLGDGDVPEHPQTPALFAARNGFAQLRAVQQQRVAPISASLVARPGPRLLLAAVALARILHPSVALPADLTVTQVGPAR